MYSQYFKCTRHEAKIDGGSKLGPLDPWRYCFSHGSINTLPLPARVAQGIGQLHPRLLRVLISEAFAIYPAHEQFDWSKLDPVMESLAHTGAKLLATIAIKPPTLFPSVNQALWRPNYLPEWQQVIAALVKRYSVDQPLVTHWEIGSATDLGEAGGSPFLIKDSREFFEFYRGITEPLLRTFPAAKVGGPGVSWMENQPLPGLIEQCRQNGTRLDFVSWHVNADTPAQHVTSVKKARALLTDFPGAAPEIMITEMNKSPDLLSLADLALEPRRAAALASMIMALIDAGLDWSFYAHLWDQTLYRAALKSSFAEIDARLAQPINELPQRLGLFSVDEEVRPQYFIYQLLSRLGEERISAHSDNQDLRIVAARSDTQVAAMLANFSLQESKDRVVTLRFGPLQPGAKLLTTYRIDDEHRWDTQRLELLPLERRVIDTPERFATQIFSPADSVTVMMLEDM